MEFLFLLVCALCASFAVGENSYRAAVVNNIDAFTNYGLVIREAAYKNADIIILPPLKGLRDSFSGRDNYDEVTRSIASSAKQARVYVVAHLSEKTHCQNSDEVIRSNLVFDREGSIIATYRKPLNKAANCTTSDHIPSFTTDFGVTFALAMEEDLVLRRPEDLKYKNILVNGGLKMEIPFLKGPQLAASWSYVTDSNLITPCGVYAGRAGLKSGSGNMAVVHLKTEHGAGKNTPMISPAAFPNFPSEDLSQYIIRPLDVEASIRGYTQDVCHGRFCCRFYVKTGYIGSPQDEVSYGLAALAGARHAAGGAHVGAQSCAILACAGLYKRSCALGPNNSTNTLFETIQITGNFSSKDSLQLPIILSTTEHNVQFNVEKTNSHNKVTINISKGKDILNFGIFGRVYSKDFDKEFVNKHGVDEVNYYDYIFNEDFQEFFDYIWIRLRIMIFIVSIYVLEMM